MIILASIALGLAALPLVLTLANLPFFRRLRHAIEAAPALSVLIPARNEEARIAPTLAAVLASRDVELELLVYDDASDDRTAEIVEELESRDSRVRLLRGEGPPAGWNGKQHACSELARAARHPLLLFLDADVVIAPDAAARIAAEMTRSGLDLLSGFPRQETGTFLEKLLLPLINFLLLGYLPLVGMRYTRKVAFGAGCGQLFCAPAAAYREAGGHAAIRASRHDGVTLPRAFRRAGLRTAIFDATDLASCRMYADAAATWNGLAKNAREGLATPVGIWVWTFLLGGGHVLPSVLALAGCFTAMQLGAWTLFLAAVGISLALRIMLALRFRQSLLGALLHPLGVLLLLTIQWQAIWRGRRGHSWSWKGRSDIRSQGKVRH